MKVLYITRGPFGVLGGSASYMIPVVMSKYCDVMVLSVQGPYSKEKIVYHNAEINICNIYAPTRKGIARNAFEQLKIFQPDVVHIFQSPRVLTYLRVFKRRFPGIKLVLDFRTQLLAKDLSHRYKMMLQFFVSQFYVNHIFAQSKYTISSNLLLRFKRMTELPIGLDISRFFPKNKSNNTPKKFIFVGLVADGRELDLLVHAFSKFVIMSGQDVQLDIVGGGNAFDALKNIIEIKRLKGVRMLGVMNQDELSRQLSDYDVGIAYVPYGRYMWAPSLKSIEYAAAGIPILASDTKGHKDYGERFGFKFNYFDNSYEGICNALNTICKVDDFSSEVENNLTSVKKFDWNEIVKNIVLPVYEKL